MPVPWGAVASTAANLLFGDKNDGSVRAAKTQQQLTEFMIQQMTAAQPAQQAAFDQQIWQGQLGQQFIPYLLNQMMQQYQGSGNVRYSLPGLRSESRREPGAVGAQPETGQPPVAEIGPGPPTVGADGGDPVDTLMAALDTIGGDAGAALGGNSYDPGTGRLQDPGHPFNNPDPFGGVNAPPVGSSVPLPGGGNPVPVDSLNPVDAVPNVPGGGDGIVDPNQGGQANLGAFDNQQFDFRRMLAEEARSSIDRSQEQGLDALQANLSGRFGLSGASPSLAAGATTELLGQMNQQRQQAALGIEQQGLGQQQNALGALAGIIMPLLNLNPSAATGAMANAGQGLMSAAQGAQGLYQMGMQQNMYNQQGLQQLMQMIGQRAFGGGNQRSFYNTSPVGSVTNLGDLNGFGRKNFNNITGPDIKSPASAGTYPNYNQFGMRDV